MPIQIGDAVLTFVADVSALDAAFIRINAQAKAQLAGASVEVQKLAGNLNIAGGQALIAGESVAAAGSEAQTASAEVQNLGNQFLGAGEKAVVAGDEMVFSMRNAKGSADLFGRAIGVELPREVRGFLAELPGVGKALESAFSAVAVYFLIDALIQGAQKLTDFIIKSYIFTDAMEKANKIVSESNQSLLSHSDVLKQLKDAYALLGLSGIAKTSGELHLLNGEIADNTSKLQAAQKEAANLNEAAGLIPSFNKQRADEVASANALVADLVAKSKELEQQKTSLQKQGAQERQALATKAALSDIQIEQDRANSIATLRANQGRAVVADAMHVSERLTSIEVLYQVDLYNNQLQALQRKAALLATDKTADPNAVKEANAQIENLQRDHASALIKIFADTVQSINSLSLDPSGRGGLAATILGTDFEGTFARAEAAAKALGITLGGTLAGNVDTAKESLASLEKVMGEGGATSRDLLRGQLALVQSELALARASGTGTTALSKQEQEMKKQLGLIPQYSRLQKQAAEQIGQAITSSAAAWGAGAVSIGIALRQITAAIIQSIADVAEKKGAEQLAMAFGAWPNFAEMASHFESAGLWFGLAGAVSAASGAVGGGGASAGSGAGSSASSGTPSQVSQPEQLPVQAVNVQRFSGGGLISKRTLAVIGDGMRGGNQREAILPLGDDSRALDEIAGRIFDRLPSSGGDIHNHYHIKGDIVDYHQLMKKQSQMVKSGQARLEASNSLRTTKRG